MPNFYEVPLVT